MHTHSAQTGHAHACSVRYDDLLLRQIIDVELDIWAEKTDRVVPHPRQAYIDEVVRQITPDIDQELCIHQFVPNHLIRLIRKSIATLLAS